jgi:plasmid replication initiation protein
VDNFYRPVVYCILLLAYGAVNLIYWTLQIGATRPPLQAEEKTVTQSNRLISAIYKMTLTEKRLLVLAISRINPVDDLPEFLSKSTMFVTVNDWMEAYPDSENPYPELKKAAKKLINRKSYVKDGAIYGDINWLSSCWYMDGSSTIKLSFTHEVLEHLYGYLEEFTSYDILNIQSLSSVYSIRLYENLIRFKTLHNRKFLIDDFKILLSVDGLYKRFASLREWVIDPAVAEINAKTPLNVTYQKLREDRKIVAINFNFSEKSPAQKSKLLENSK